MTYHHKNTEKIAQAFAKVLGAEVKTPKEITPEELATYDLIGFGSRIYDAKHHKVLLDLADKLPPVTNKDTFIFSTDGAPRSMMKQGLQKNHVPLREKLQ